MKLSREILAKARDLFPNEPFRLITDWGEVLILPPEFADEIRNDPRLSFSKAAMQVSTTSNTMDFLTSERTTLRYRTTMLEYLDSRLLPL